MSSELKIFHSLNCSLCKSPYSKSIDNPKYPYQLLYGRVVCKECWEKEKSLKKDRCDFDWDCDFTGKFPSFLRLLLKDPSIIESPNGWLLSEPITYLLKCQKCDGKCSMEKDESKPFILSCGHAICTKCYLTHRTADSTEDLYWMRCPICTTSYLYPISSSDDWLREFLRELPQLIEQIPKVQKIRQVLSRELFEKQTKVKKTCGDCEKEAPLFEMFQCNDCGKVMFCSVCGMRKHHSHKIVDLGIVEVKKLMNATSEVITSQIKAYDDRFPKLQADLINKIHNFQEKAREKFGKIEGLNYDPAKYELRDCLAIGEEFEGICEKYLTKETKETS